MSRSAAAAGALLLLLAHGPARAEWQSFHPIDGLATDDIRSLAEDRAGNLWIGTVHGVSRYDGVNWTTFGFRARFDTSYVTEVSALLVDRAGNLWLGTGGSGAVRFDGARWTTFTTDDGLASDGVSAIAQDRAGNLWFATRGAGVSRFDGTRWTTFTSADGLASDQVRAMIADRSGNVWFGTPAGAGRFDGSQWTTFPVCDPLPCDEVMALLEDRSGGVWVGTFAAGAARFDGTQWMRYDVGGVRAMLEDRDGSVWLGISGGALLRHDGRSWREFRPPPDQPVNEPTAILQDRPGNLWFGSYTQGLRRFDGVEWKTFGSADGLGEVTAIHEDRSGAVWAGASRFDGTAWTRPIPLDGAGVIFEDHAGLLWFGGNGQGATRYDGQTWTTFDYFSGSLPDNGVTGIGEDGQGNIWIGHSLGVTRYDGKAFRTFTRNDGLADDLVLSVLGDRAGNMWFGTYGALTRFDGAQWTTFPEVTNVRTIHQDRAGRLWFGVRRFEEPFGALVRYDGATFRTFTAAEGLSRGFLQDIADDASGRLWVATSTGLSIFDGESWRLISTADGLPENNVRAVAVDRTGAMWLGTYFGATRFDADRVAPRTVFLSTPSSPSASRSQTASVLAAFREAVGIEFSFSLDGGPWSAWAPVNAWTANNLSEGLHTLAARTHDRYLNLEREPASASFEIDATPPAPIITSPAFGEAVSDTLVIRGAAQDARFQSYRIDIRPAGASSWTPPAAAGLRQWFAPQSGVLARSDTRRFADGTYELRLAVTDTLGLTGTAFTTLVIDNQAPRASETSPARVSSATGGDAYTTDGEVHLYFPPHAFRRDAVVTIAVLDSAGLPAVLPDGAVRGSPGYEISWAGEKLLKPVIAEWSYAGGGPPPQRLALYAAGSDGVWSRLGGTVDEAGRRVAGTITETGRYALFAESAVPGASSSGVKLSALSLTPRVFSPHGAFASKEVAIGFTLGRAGAVTVKVYNRAGRLVREVASGLGLAAGVNLVRWDGRDGDGREVKDDLYLVSVEALGETRTHTLAVVR